MATSFFVTLDKIRDEFSLEEIYSPCKCEDIKIYSSDVNRPGLQLVGEYEFFDERRIQILGNAEYGYINKLSDEEKMKVSDELLSRKPPLVVIARSYEIIPQMLECAKKYGVFIMRTSESTSHFLAGIVSYLNVELAPRITRHGVLIEAYGEGILMLGESGVGKSETAIELVKRGHRLIADDAVEIRRVSGKTLVGTSPENIRHYVELRGIGIINVASIFGVGSVKVTEKIDMVINLEPWDNSKVYDRIGTENEKINILGIDVECLTIPVKPGRNLAVIIEVAAINNRQKKMGYNASLDLMNKIGMINDDSVGDIAPRAKI